MRPVPVVLRRLAFSLQLSIDCQNHCFILEDIKTSHTLSDLSSRVAAVGTSALLDVERTLSYCRSHVSFRSSH